MANYVGFVDGADDRGTLGLIYGVLSTVFLCTWNSLHMNLPADHDSNVAIILRQLKWTAFGIICPEYLAVTALKDRFQVRWSHREIMKLIEASETSMENGDRKSFCTPPSSPEPCDQTLDGNKDRAIELQGLTEEVMVKDNNEDTVAPAALSTGAYSTRESGGTNPGLAEDNARSEGDGDINNTQSLEENTSACLQKGATTSTTGADTDVRATSKSQDPIDTSFGATAKNNRSCWSIRLTFFVNQGGFNLVFLDGETYRINIIQFLALLKGGYINLPDILEEAIRDKSKADRLGKGLACLQLTWYVVYLTGRAAQHLPVTTLELSALSIVCCSFFNWFAWWFKAKGVEHPINLPTKYLKSDLQEALAEERGKASFRYVGQRVSLHDAIGRKTTGAKFFDLVYCLPMIVFAGCHFLGWNLFFPTKVEIIFWKIACVGSLLTPLAAFFLADLAQRVRKYQRSFNIALFLVAATYIILRTYLFVEAILGLRHVPASVYDDVSWTRGWIPHVGG